MRCFAPAKINLVLQVVGKRADGYHLLRTVMTFFPRYDLLDITLLDEPGTVLYTDSPVTKRPEDNLVVRAVNRLRNETGIVTGVKIQLKKQIPVAAGLGGGSSDAATLLLALNRLWGNPLSQERLLEIGLDLGADVPFFVKGVSALAEGIGEILTPLPELPTMALTVVNPGVPLATGEVFQNCFLNSEELATLATLTTERRSISVSGDRFENDLEKVAIRLEPKIGQAMHLLKSAGAREIMMTGSGPSVFGVFPSEIAASRAVALVLRRQPTWHSFSGRTFNHHPYWAVAKR